MINTGGVASGSTATIAGWPRLITTPTPLVKIRWAVQDTIVIARRDLMRFARRPELFWGEVSFPIMFLLLFNYVFGGAIGDGADIDYTQFLVPAIMIQTALFGATQTGVGLADDLSKGVVDRFRSLPMSRIAVLAGRTVSDSVRNTAATGMLIVLGYALGFRFTGLPEALAAVAIAVWAGFSISWMSSALASALRNAEAVQMVNMLWLFPMMFASSLFVPTETMPNWLQPIASNQPISVITDAARSVSDGTAAAGEILSALAWMTGLMVVFMFLAVRQFNRQT